MLLSHLEVLHVGTLGLVGCGFLVCSHQGMYLGFGVFDWLISQVHVDDQPPSTVVALQQVVEEFKDFVVSRYSSFTHPPSRCVLLVSGWLHLLQSIGPCSLCCLLNG